MVKTILKKLISRKVKHKEKPSGDVNLNGYIYFNEFHPGLFRRSGIFTTRNIENFEQAERREIVSLGGIIEPPRFMLNVSEFDREILEQAWVSYREQLNRKGIILPDEEITNS